LIEIVTVNVQLSLRLDLLCLILPEGRHIKASGEYLSTGHAKATICKQIGGGPRMYIHIGMGGFHGFTVYCAPNFHGTRTATVTVFLRYSLVMPYYK